MASCSKEGLEDLLGRAGLATPIPDFAGSNILHNLQDIFKVYLADALRNAVDCDKLVAYDAIQPSNMTGGGDLVVVAPKLRQSGTSHDALVVDLAEKVKSLVALFWGPSEHKLIVGLHKHSCPAGLHLLLLSAMASAFA